MRRRVRIVGAVAVALIALSGCRGDAAAPAEGAGSGSAAPSGAGSKAEQSPDAAKPVSVSVTPADDTVKARPDKGVSVSATDGRLTAVTVTAADGTKVAGELVDGGTGWRNTAHLAPSATYTVKVTAENADGVVKKATSSFKTVRPASVLSTSLQPSDGWTVGVGMPIVVTFDHTVKNRDAVLKSLSVKATPATEGAWRWTTSQQVQWRPKEFWTPGTKVKVVADLKGVEVAKGVWGKRTRTADFEIGSAMVSTVDIAAHTLTVRKNGKVIKKIPVTTGKSGFATRNGTKVIISRETSHKMDAATTGTSQDSPEYYNLTVKYAMRLTWSGEFFHAAPWSVGSQGRANVSHGCTGMSMANAAWLFSHSKVGDVVKYVNGSRKLEDGNGYTAWNMSYAQWSQGA